MAMGNVKEFSWSAVATSALTAGLTQGISPVDGADWYVKAGYAAARNVVGQGVSIAMGQQEKFDWRSVATSAIAAPMAQAVGAEAGKGVSDPFTRDFVSGMASGVVTQGVHIMVYGGGKMDFAAIAADSFGNALGNSLVRDLRAERAKYSLAGMGKSSVGLKASGGIGLSYGGVTGSDVPEADGSNGQAASGPATYTVKKGDNLSKILGTSDPIVIGATMRVNGMESSMIQPGQELTLPDNYNEGDARRGQATLNADN
jgi:hypothetical protein